MVKNKEKEKEYNIMFGKVMEIKTKNSSNFNENDFLK